MSIAIENTVIQDVCELIDTLTVLASCSKANDFKQDGTKLPQNCHL